MILSLHAQAQLFLLTVLLGGGMGLFYDGLRVFRHALRHNAFWVQVEDGLFWLLAVFLVFCVIAARQCRRNPVFYDSGAVRRHGAVFPDAQPHGTRCQR